MTEILRAISEYPKDGGDLVLAVITERTGSAPRGKGAAMLTGKQGLLAGSVGGGMLEAEVLQEARRCLAEKRSISLHFLLNGGAPVDPKDLEGGMICGGEVSLWLQFIDAGQDPWRKTAGEALAIAEDGDSAFLRIDTGKGSVAIAVAAPPEAEPGVFYLPFSPPERALIFGGGHVAAALVPILKSVGFQVTVMDSRPEFAAASRFPDAEQVICGSFLHIDSFLTVCPRDYAVVVTSGHIHDFEVEEQLLRRELAYVGVIGSRRKTAAVNAKLRDAGISEEQLARVHTPIGLDIGAVTPAELAVSIAAEMIQVRAEKRESKK